MLVDSFLFFSKVASVLARHGPNKGLSCGRAGWLARGSLLMGRWGWERPGPDSILPRGGARPTPAAIQLCFCLLCAQALHKVLDLTRGDGRRWSLRQDRRPGSLAPVKRQPTSTSINPPHFAHSLLHPPPAFRSVSSEIQPPATPTPFRVHLLVRQTAHSTTACTCKSNLTTQPHAHLH